MAFFCLLSPRALGIATNIFQCKWFSTAFLLLHFCVNYIILFTFPSFNINCPLSPQIEGKVRSPTFTLSSFRDCHMTMMRYKKYWFIVPILTNINGYWVIQIKQYFYARSKSASHNIQTSVVWPYPEFRIIDNSRSQGNSSRFCSLGERQARRLIITMHWLSQVSLIK